ncbi:MAG: hypothetical protein A2Z14_14210 [Chloroflexi bacterium RBG_16_48_8]|nr:MAG: hypothetical protein A2Z14_14210 [Chloroflexi bacterium RBG_16_48_8]
MSEEPLLNETGPTSDDKLFAALAYVFSPLVPIIILFLEDKKNRPFIRAHNVQALVAGIVLAVILSILTVITCGVGLLGWFVWLLMLYWAYKAYQGEYINIPLITDFVKGQGWA